MEFEPFKLERYFAKYEFSSRFLLSASDCDGLSQRELLSMVDPESRKLWDNLTLGYTESQGNPILRQEIVGLYKGITHENVLVSAPEEGIFVAMSSLLKKGDHVITTFPGYQSLSEIAKGIGCEVTPWESDEKENWRFNTKFLEESIRPNTKLVVINFPHNPTGYLPPKDDFEKIIDITRSSGAYLFSDEMYRYLEYNPEDRLPSACEIYDKAITLFGMSKTFGLAGLRIGWLATQDQEMYQRMLNFKDYTTICSSAPSEILALIGLRNKDQIIQKNLNVINRNLNLLDGFFERQKGLVSWVRPKAGTIGFPRINGFDSSDFCERIVRDTGIMVVPSTVFDYGKSHFRIGFGRENFPEVLEIFEDYLDYFNDSNQ